MQIGELIKETRIEKGVTQKELAEKIGMRQKDISNLEKGKQNPRSILLIQIAQVLDMDLNRLKSH